MPPARLGGEAFPPAAQHLQQRVTAGYPSSDEDCPHLDASRLLRQMISQATSLDLVLVGVTHYTGRWGSVRDIALRFHKR